jgi:ABC-type sugar transport system ATPase subunit
LAEIRFENVGKRFGDVEVVRALDLTVRDGEFFTFVGPSGCGKSTILNMIAGLEGLSGGNIFFDGSPVNHLSPAERDVAMVFQSYALYPHMSVRDNLAFPLVMKKAGKAVVEREVERVSALLGIGELLDRKPAQLSGGQKQRVALGRAIIRRPRAFLMDEPLSNLDARLRVEMRVELKRLHRELGITTIYVTHDQSEALALSGRIAVLNRGSVEQCGDPNEIFFRPANLFVAGFIGAPPMNFIPARVLRAAPLEIECQGVAFSPVTEKAPEGVSLIVGVRPETLAVARESTDGSVAVTVSMVEPAGLVNWVEVEWNGLMLKGVADAGTDMKPGEKIFASFPAHRALIFDPETGGLY